VTTLGAIFNVPNVATQVNANLKYDFEVAKSASKQPGHKQLKAILYDSVGCRIDGVYNENNIFAGAGKGSANLVIESAGMVNGFSDIPGSYKCVPMQQVIDAKPDVLLLVDADWDGKFNKIDKLYSTPEWCNQPYVKGADLITIPFSASALGPRNGAAALDLVSAGIHVTTGGETLDFESGVGFFDPKELVDYTKNMLCPLALENIAYSGVTKAPTDQLEGWAIALIVVLAVLFGGLAILLVLVVVRERKGEPIFGPVVPSDEPVKAVDPPKNNV